MKKVTFPSCKKVQRKKTKSIPFLVTYHPILKYNMNAKIKQKFTPVQMVSYRSSRKLRSYLVRVKLYPIDVILGFKGCGKKQYEVYVDVCEIDTFSSTVTEETFEITDKLNFDDKYLIYLFTCKCCGK